jgi:4-alpha-glucanotransferase
LHPIYISLSEIPETMAALGLPLQESTVREIVRDSRAIDRKFCTAIRVPFEEILNAKLGTLRTVWNSNNEVCTSLAESFAAEESWAKPYGCFVALKEKYGGAPWWEWPEWREVRSEHIEELWFLPATAEEARFRLWLQVLAREQLQHAAREVSQKGIDIMGDIPILLAKDSADVWYRRDIFIMDRQAGAPPDMYSPQGQNWGVPLYDWEVLCARGYDFWRERLAYADKFYTCYRIDHVLGFFRIWALSIYERDAYLGTFEPSTHLRREVLKELGFPEERITWLSKPHVREHKIIQAERECLAKIEGSDERKKAFAERLAELRANIFARIKNEDLFLFNAQIRGTSDIYAFTTALQQEFPEVREPLEEYGSTLARWWFDRALYEVSLGEFVFQWAFRDTSSWKSLSIEEQNKLEAKALAMNKDSLEIWENQGRELLSMLISATGMQPFAEDLGAVPLCVPKVLRELEIPGLRVMRWERKWDAPGQPYIHLQNYEPLSVACTSVHDSTNIRQWWEEEADRQQVWNMCAALSSSDRTLCDTMDAVIGAGTEPPPVLTEKAAIVLIRALALSSSLVTVYPIQDLLACFTLYREPDPHCERINTPGTTLDSNWKYKMPIDIPVLVKDKEFCATISELTARGAAR